MRRAPRLLLGTAVLGLVLGAACGDSGAEDAAPTTTGTPATTGAPATTAAADPSVPATTAAPPTTAPASTAGQASAGDEERLAQDGDTVEVHYRGTLDDGSEFDSSRGRSPLTFVVGSGQVISGFDDAVRGLGVGEERTVRIEPEDAYGQPDPDLIVEFPATEVPEGLTVGEQVTFANGARGVVLEITDEVVRIDANHPLAGQALTFAVELVSIG